MNKLAVLFLFSLQCAEAFVAPRPVFREVSTLLRETASEPIISPFDNTADDGDADSTSAVATESLEGPLELTWENVEMVLDEMRPYLIQDGGNVAITEIDGPVVRLELQVSKHQRPVVMYDRNSSTLVYSPHNSFYRATGSLWNVSLLHSNHEDGFGERLA